MTQGSGKILPINPHDYQSEKQSYRIPGNKGPTRGFSQGNRRTCNPLNDPHPWAPEARGQPKLPNSFIFLLFCPKIVASAPAALPCFRRPCRASPFSRKLKTLGARTSPGSRAERFRREIIPKSTSLKSSDFHECVFFWSLGIGSLEVYTYLF